MSDSGSGFDVILLAAQRSGVVNPLAQRHGTSHKCLIPIDGVPLIERMLNILTTHPGCRAIRILIEPDGMAQVRKTVDALGLADRPEAPAIGFIASSENIAQSVIQGCEAAEPPFVITTADNVLLKHASLDRMMEGFAGGADALIALAEKKDILAVHPEAQRHFYEFRDGGYANCNLYGIAGPAALKAAEIFREGGQFMSSATRMINAFGLWNIILMRLGLVSVERGFERVGRKLGLDIAVVRLADGTQAIDVDNERTYDIVEGVLQGRFPA